MEPLSASRVTELLLQWVALGGGEKEIDLRQLCGGDTTLAAELEREIRNLDSIQHLLSSPTKSYGPADVPPAGGAAPAAPPAWLDRYQVRRLIGQGGFGQVWEAYDPLLRRDVAIKIPRADRPLSGAELDDFLGDARKAAALGDHPNVVRVHDARRVGPTCFIVSDLIRGRSLAERVRQGRLPPEEAARVAAEVAAALDHAHLRGLVHRDVKPGNILLGEGGKVYLADFGLALSEEEQPGSRNQVAGSLPYMSPEQVRGESHHLDGRSDVYSLGVVLYELLAGRRPFEGQARSDLKDQILHREPRPPRAVDPAVPPELERVCLKCLRKSSAERYATARDLADDLRRWLRSRGRQPRLLWPAAAAGGAVLILAAALLVRQGVSPGPAPPPGGTVDRERPVVAVVPRDAILPVELQWGRRDSMTAEVLPEQNAVRLVAEDLGFLSLGRLDGVTEVGVTIDQRNWEGRVGFFFECPTASAAENKKYRQFQVVFLEKWFQDGSHRLRVEHCKLWRLNAASSVTSPLATIPLPALDPYPRRLAVKFDAGGLKDIVFDGTSYAGELRPQLEKWVPFYCPGPEYRGEFGVWCLDTSATVSDPAINGEQRRFVKGIP